jgi:hypothetical protein
MDLPLGGVRPIWSVCAVSLLAATSFTVVEDAQRRGQSAGPIRAGQVLLLVCSTRIEFAINLATAKSLGLQIPSGVLAIADEVIE